MKIGIIGTGAVGTAIAALLTEAGHQVLLGSRSPDGRVVPYENAIKNSDIIFIAVPFSAVESILPPLASAIGDRIVIDATNPLNEDWSPMILGQGSSAAELIANMLPRARVIKAFNTIFADIMSSSGFDRDGHKTTAFIAGDDDQDVAVVAELASDMGLAPIQTGSLSTARHLEAMAHLNISIALGRKGGTNAAFVYHHG